MKSSSENLQTTPSNPPPPPAPDVRTTSALKQPVLVRIVTWLVKWLVVIAVVCSPLSGCAYMTKSGRQQLAYQRYIKRCSGKKVRIVKMKVPRMPKTPPPSPPTVTTQVSDSPLSMSSGESQ